MATLSAPRAFVALAGEAGLSSVAPPAAEEDAPGSLRALGAGLLDLAAGDGPSRFVPVALAALFAPEAPETPEALEGSGAPEALEGSEAPAPEALEAPEGPEAPEAPEALEAPEAPVAPEASEDTAGVSMSSRSVNGRLRS
jgi:hypothetical protein